MEWAATKMQTANLWDKRLSKRLVSLLGALGNHSQASILVACGGWAETKAAYRFFDNEHVTADKILAPIALQALNELSSKTLCFLFKILQH